MAWPLFDAVLRCLWRRGRSFALRAPLPAAVIAAVLVLAPLALARATSSVARASAAALADPQATRIIALALLVPAAAAGAAASRLVPAAERLGAAVVAAPVRRGPAALAAALPTLLAALAFVPLATSVAVPFALASPGGLPAAAALGAGVAAAVAVGAAAAQLADRARRGDAAGVALVVGLASAGLGLGVAVAGDPAALLAEVLAGRAGAGAATLDAAVVLVAATVVWGLALRLRPAGARRRGRLRRLRAPLGRLPLLSLALLVLLRRAEPRGAVAAGALLGLGGALLGRVVGLDADAALLLGLTSVLASAAVAPLAVGGAVTSLRWVIGIAPVDRTRVAVAWLAAAATATTLSLLPLVCLAAAEGVLTARSLGAFALGILLATGCGVLAGSIAVWRPGAIGDQTLALGLLAVVAAGAGALALGGAWVGDRIGLDDRWMSVVVGSAPLVAAVPVLARRVGRG